MCSSDLSVPVFCYFCIPEKLVWKYSRNWTKPFREVLFFQKTQDDAKKQQRRPTGAPHAMRARVPPWPRPHTVWAPRGSPAAALSPTYSPRENNPKYLSHYPRKVPETPPPSTLAREGPEPLLGTLPERGIVTGGFYIAMPASEVMCE